MMTKAVCQDILNASWKRGPLGASRRRSPVPGDGGAASGPAAAGRRRRLAGAAADSAPGYPAAHARAAVALAAVVASAALPGRPRPGRGPDGLNGALGAAATV